MEILKPKDVSNILNVTVNTLQKWDREGKLKAKRNIASDRRYYTRDQIDEFLGNKDRISSDIVIYSRVSSNGQKEDLNNQIEFLKEYANVKGYIVNEIITDIGSGLNYNRPKWNELLDKIVEKRISRVIVSYKDRFIRFGFEWFERFCKKFGCEIEVVNNEKTSPEQEMVEDLISIIHCFSCRVYGLRKYKKVVESDKDICEHTK